MPLIIRTLLTTLCVGAWLVSPASAKEVQAEPWPVEGQVALMTLPPFDVTLGSNGASNAGWQAAGSLELGPRDGFWSVGGIRWIDHLGQDDTSPSITTVFGRAKWRMNAEQTWSLLGGWNYAPKTLACLGIPNGCTPYTPYGLLVAASWAYRNEHLWVNVTPQYTFPLYGERREEGWMLSMVPWLELGWRVTPAVGLAFRLGPAPIKLSFDF